MTTSTATPKDGSSPRRPLSAASVTTLLGQLAVPVMGCTEPAAIALAVALAAEAARGRVPAWATGAAPRGPAGRTQAFTLEAVQIRTVRSLYKNALAVGIPNTHGGSGIYLAAALGPFLDPAAGLNLLKGIDDEALALARTLLGSGRLGIAVQEHGAEGLFVEAQVIGVFEGVRHVGEAMILGEHDGVTRLRQDGRPLLEKSPATGRRHPPQDKDPVEGRSRDPVEGRSHDPAEGRSHDPVEGRSRDPVEGRSRDPAEGRSHDPVEGSPGEGQSVPEALDALQRCSLSGLLDLVRGLDAAGRRHALWGVAMNRAAAEEGIARGLGLGVGAHLQRLTESGTLAADVASRASILAAGATDARMSGHDVEVMSSSGSGNQGIMVVLPVLAVAEAEGLDENDPRLAEAVALAHLLTAVMTRHTGLLSALCGCVVKAGLGAAAGCGHLLGLDARDILGALRNMAGNMTGEICDGAKVGCAVKLSTAARAAVLSAYQARDGVTIPASNGILASSAEGLFANIGEVAHSMREVDRTIVAIMEKKQVEEPWET